ncbi:MAG: hypothetical protein AM325_011470 [Candidatus Thorarchaeota archaeon SMTZ1-45]|nr:MAG: hypothetical protein AM325_13160 [Candidatus Thorarchaeota archaeon SMTZ1-45]
MSNDELSWELCNELVAGEIATRCLIVSYLIHRLPDKYGDEILEDIKKANYDAGFVAGKNAAKAIGKNDLVTLGELFGGTSVFNPEIIEISEERAVIHWRRCPVPTLIPAFNDEGLSSSYIETVCPILELFDNGFVEGWNPELQAQTPPEIGETDLQKGGEFCTVIITKMKK